ncbi:multidrug resistance-associated protein 5 [Tanacetum coccineum]
MLQELRSARCLILNKDIVECISSFLDLLSHLPSPVSNLISLNITSNMRNEHKVKLSAEARNFLSRELSKCHLTYVDGVILEMVVRRMPYEEFAGLVLTAKRVNRKVLVKMQRFVDTRRTSIEIELLDLSYESDDDVLVCLLDWRHWKAWCRKIIALEVVNVENKDNWTWFLELLEQDLGSSRGNGLTLMSDQHKGLIEVVKDVMPNAEHRQCASLLEALEMEALVDAMDVDNE